MGPKEDCGSMSSRRSEAIPARQSSASLTFGKILSVLDCFTVSTISLSATELAQKMGVNMSTLYRYLSTLEEKGFLERDPQTNRYSIGLRVVELGGIALSRLEVRRHGQVELDSLSNALDMNANLGVLYHGDILHLAFAVRSDVDRMYATIGRRTPAHCTAMGRSIYAHMPRQEVHEVITAHGWRPLTEFSPRSFEELDKDLDAIAVRGYAVDSRATNLRTMCVGAPVFDQSLNVVAAISVSSRPDILETRIEDTAREVVHYAERISVKLGYNPRLV